ncbi:AMP-binding protein [Flavilitoribacter nigricans]|nr:AMP-binding protein [Flavilitoribacter nigricans]
MIENTIPWDRHYPEGISYRLDTPSQNSLVDLMEKSFADYASLPALDCLETSISYRELDQRSRDFAAYLQQYLGLAAGTRIAIQLPTLLQYPIAMLGALRAGMIVVNVAPQCTSDELKQLLVDSGAEAIVILANFAHQLEAILPETSIRHIVVTQLGDQLRTWQKWIVNATVKYGKKLIPAYRLPTAVPFGRALRRGSWQFFQSVPVKADTIAFLNYTDGTTGVNIATVLTHADVVAGIEQFSSRFPLGLKSARALENMSMPPTNAYAQAFNCLMVMKFGGRNVLVPKPGDTASLIRLLKAYNPKTGTEPAF